MKASTEKTATTTSTTATQTPQEPFFGKKGGEGFFESTPQGNAPFIQAKLTINQPGDIYEQEADRVADQVVQRLAMPSPEPASPLLSTAGKSPAPIQTKCADCEQEEKLQRKEEEGPEEREEIMRKVDSTFPAQPLADIQMKCADCEQEEQIQGKEKEGPEEQEEIMRQAESASPAQPGDGAGSDFSTRLQSSKGGGSPLPENTRSDMESALGTDLSGVRIHTGGEAAGMSKDINAQAFTHGSDVYFNDGKFDAGSSDGKRLLAHELVHVGQQGEGGRNKIMRSKEFDYSHAISENKKYHEDPIDDQFLAISLYIFFSEDSNLKLIYSKFYEKTYDNPYAKIDNQYVDVIIKLQKKLYPNKVEKHNGVFDSAVHAEMQKQTSLLKVSALKKKSLTGNKEIDDAITYHIDNQIFFAEVFYVWISPQDITGKIVPYYLELLRDGSKKVEPYLEVVQMHGDRFTLFIKYVKLAQEIIYPNNSKKHTGMLDKETIYLLDALRGNPYSSKGCRPIWIDNAVSYNKKNKTFAKKTALELFKITGNRGLYQEALKSEGEGESFSLLVWHSQLILAATSPQMQDGKLGPITLALLGIYESISKTVLEKINTQTSYFDLKLYNDPSKYGEIAFQINSHDIYGLKNKFSELIYGKTYDLLTIEEDQELLNKANSRFLDDEHFTKMLKNEGYDLTLGKFAQLNNSSKRSFHHVFSSLFKGLAVGLKSLMAPVDLWIYSPIGRQALGNKAVFDTLHQIESELQQLQRWKLMGYDVGKSIEQQESKLKKHVETYLSKHYKNYEEYLEERGMTGIERSALYKLGTSYDEWAKKTFPVNPKYKGSFFLDTLPSATGGAAAFILVELVSKAFLLPPGVGAGALGILTGMGSGYELALQYGATDDTAVEVAYLFGLVGAFQSIPFGQFLGRMETITLGQFSKSIFKEVFKEMLSGGITMSTVGFASGVLQRLTIQQYLDASQSIIDTQLWKEAGAAGLLGIVLGGMGAMLKIKRPPAEEKNIKVMRQKVEKILYPDKEVNPNVKVLGMTETVIPGKSEVVFRMEILLTMRNKVVSELGNIQEGTIYESPQSIDASFEATTLSMKYASKTDLQNYLLTLDNVIAGMKSLEASMQISWQEQIKLGNYDLKMVREKYGSDGSKTQDKALQKAWMGGWRPKNEIQNKGSQLEKASENNNNNNKTETNSPIDNNLDISNDLQTDIQISVQDVDVVLPNVLEESNTIPKVETHEENTLQPDIIESKYRIQKELDDILISLPTKSAKYRFIKDFIDNFIQEKKYKYDPLIAQNILEYIKVKDRPGRSFGKIYFKFKRGYKLDINKKKPVHPDNVRKSQSKFAKESLEQFEIYAGFKIPSIFAYLFENHHFVEFKFKNKVTYKFFIKEIGFDIESGKINGFPLLKNSYEKTLQSYFKETGRDLEVDFPEITFWRDKPYHKGPHPKEYDAFLNEQLGPVVKDYLEHNDQDKATKDLVEAIENTREAILSNQIKIRKKL